MVKAVSTTWYMCEASQVRRVLDAGEDGGGTACEQEEENEARRRTALWRFQVDTPSPSECLSPVTVSHNLGMP